MNRLQLRHGIETKFFPSREEAVSYANKKIRDGLTEVSPYEPVLLFYGGNEDKNALLLIGLPDGATKDGSSFFVIDTETLSKRIDGWDDEIKSLHDEDEKIWVEIEKIEGDVEKNRDSIEFSKADILNIVEACGLIYNESLPEKRVTYVPDPYNVIINETKSVSEAINVVANFALDLSKRVLFNVKNTNTVSLKIETNETSGERTLSADVNVDTESIDVDNNILGKTTSGLYASSSLETSTTKPNTLIFKTSGYQDGQFKREANQKEVQLPTYSGDNGKTSGVEVSVDNTNNVISAQLNLSSNADNILKLEDGEYSVNGRAANIKYKGTNVAKALSEAEEEIQALKSVEISGLETQSSIVTVNKLSSGSLTVSNDVKLNGNKSIIVADGGLAADVSAEFIKEKATLEIKVGNQIYSLNLSSLGVSVLKEAAYDSATEEIVLVFIVGDAEKTLRIPVGKLIHDVDVEDTNTVNLTLTSISGGPNTIKADVKIDSEHSDNILTTSDSGLYVAKSHITDAVNNAVSVEEAAREEADAKLNEKIIENVEAIASEVSRAQAKENSLSESIEDEKSRAMAKEDALAESIETDRSRAIAKETEISENLVTETNRAKSSETELATSVTTERTRATSAEEAITTRIDNEVERAESSFASLAENLVSEISRATNIEADLSSQINLLNTNVDGIELRKIGDLSYALYVKDVKHGEFTIPSDQFLKEVIYYQEAKTLVFTRVTSSGESKTVISLLDLVDIYSAGDGLKLTDKVFSVDFSNVASVSGVNAIQENVDLVSAALEQEKTRSIAADYANSTAISDEATRAANKELELSNSILEEKNRAMSKESELANSVDTEKTRAMSAESAITTALENEVSRSTTAEAQINTSISSLNQTLQQKANSSDVYTKAETLEKLSDYALESDMLSQLSNKMNVTDAQNTFATKDALQTVKDTYSTQENVSRIASSLSERIIENDLSISTINLTYNEVTSDLTYTDWRGFTQAWHLYNGSLVKSGEFDETSNSIILTIENLGIESKITIPVDSLLSEINARVSANESSILTINNELATKSNKWETLDTGTLSLSKSGDILSGNVKIASSNKQAIKSESNGLYVSNDLEDFTCVFGGEGTISGQTAISKLLERVTELTSTVSALTSRVEDAEGQIAYLTEENAKTEAKVVALQEQLNTVKNGLEELKEEVDEINVDDLKERLTALEESIDGGFYSEEITE